MTLRRKGLTSQLDRNFVEDDAGAVSNSDVPLEPVTHPEVDVCKDKRRKVPIADALRRLERRRSSFERRRPVEFGGRGFLLFQRPKGFETLFVESFVVFFPPMMRGF